MNARLQTCKPAAVQEAVTRGAPALYAPPTADARPLRVTMVLPEQIPRWLSTFIDLAATNDWIHLSILPVAGAASPRVSGMPLGLRTYLALERIRQRGCSRTLSTVPIHPRNGVDIAPTVDSSAEPGRMRAEFETLRPDLIVLLGSAHWAKPLSMYAQWGCWSLNANLVDRDHAGAALLIPIVHNESATAIELELGLHSAVLPLATSWGTTQPGSFTQQREQAFLKLPALLVRALHRLACGQLAAPRHATAVLRQSSPRSLQGLATALRAMAITWHNAIRWQLRKRRRWLPWMVVLREGEAAIDPHAARMHASKAIQAPQGVCWADPCLVDDSGRRLLFVEELAGRKAGGAIACVELDNGEARRLGLVLKEPVHLSYPQVFQWQDEWYLTVESSQARRVSLYRATAFPLGWQRIEDLVTSWACVDPTLHYHDGHWYLFANVAECGNSTWDELFLFVADQLTGPYRPHPANPIVSDVRRARPAGRLFHYGQSLIRPSQDCAGGYGAGLVFNEVLELSPERYRERVLSRLAPDWAPGLEACHTYSAAGGIEVVDARGLPAPDTTLLRVASWGRVAVA